MLASIHHCVRCENLSLRSNDCYLMCSSSNPECEFKEIKLMTLIDCICDGSTEASSFLNHMIHGGVYTRFS